MIGRPTVTSQLADATQAIAEVEKRISRADFSLAELIDSLDEPRLPNEWVLEIDKIRVRLWKIRSELRGADHGSSPISQDSSI